MTGEPRRAFGLHLQGVRRLRKRARRVGRFAAILARLKQRHGALLQYKPHAAERRDQNQRRNRAAIYGLAFGLRADLLRDHPKKPRHQQARQQEKQNPRIERRRQIPRDPSRTKRPQQLHAITIRQIEQHMQSAPRQRRQKCRHKFQRRRGICTGRSLPAGRQACLRPFSSHYSSDARRDQDVGRRNRRGNHDDPHNRMRRRAMPFQKRTRPAEHRNPIDIRREPRRHGNRQRQRRNAFESAPRQRHRSQHLCDRFHIG